MSNLKIKKDLELVKMSKGRLLSWVLYPDDKKSMELLQYIVSTRSSAFILHDRDLNDDDTPKIPHYHVMVLFPNPVEAGRLKEDGKHTGYCKIVSEAVGRTVRVNAYSSVAESIAYFLHEDFSSFFNPHKFHYSINDFVGSYSILKHYKSLKFDEEEILMELENLAVYKRMQFCDLWRYCVLNKSRRPELFGVFNKYHRQILTLLQSVAFDGSTFYGKDFLKDSEKYLDNWEKIC